jgi:putative PIN family toxin of toxin-antitoxin system
MIRVVLDANIYVSALLKPNGPQADLIKKGFKGDFEIVLSEDIFLELCRVLQYPRISERLPLSQDQLKIFLERLIDVAAWTSGEVTVVLCEDAADDIYLSCAKEAQADFLVSGDQHLLKIKKFERTAILMSREFLEYLRSA